MRRPFATLAFCVLTLLLPAAAARASWDWVDMMRPLKDYQASVANVNSEQQLYEIAKKGDWWGRTSAVLRLGELATPKAGQVLCKLYSEWPADLVVDSPPDVSFFALATLGATKTAVAHGYLEHVIADLEAGTPVPVVSDAKDRWLGALKGLSYFTDASHVSWCERLALNPHLSNIVREWASECAVEMELSLKGLSTARDRAAKICSELEGKEKLSALRRRVLERRLVAYVAGDGRVEALVSSLASRVKDRDLKRAYTNIVELARLSRANPRTGNPADRLGRF